MRFDSRKQPPPPSGTDRPASRQLHVTAPETERALLVGVTWSHITLALAADYLDELDMLAQTAGAVVVGKEIARRAKPDPGLLVGKGKAEELAQIVEETRANLVIFDDDLSPAQVRNLESALRQRVIDRSGLILDIFARRARTREAKTQVELAQLRYVLPRLAGAWVHLERQRGGIGLRGPGETQIETDRRLIRQRIRQLEQELRHIDRIRSTQRAGRTDAYCFALAGYTNVGKSTLMNALTRAGVFEENLLFATLDSTTRVLQLSPKFHAVLTDTVGFIRKLPLHLVASFRSTLMDIRDANCILHVVDLAAHACREQLTEVEKILAEMGLADCPRITIFNKLDALEDDVNLCWAQREYPDALFISAKDGTGVPRLLEAMREAMAAELVELSVEVPAADGKRLAEIHRLSDVLQETQTDTTIHLHVRIPKEQAHRLGLVGKG